MPRFRTEIDDFEVEELPLYPPTGDGDHTLVLVEKRDRTTVGVADDLARAAGVGRFEVGFAGRKDKRAVTRQWFSVPCLPGDCAESLELPGAVVLRADRHRHKIRPGDLRGNRFRIVVREVSEVERNAALDNLECLRSSGLANRFGAQRFGRDGDNAALGAALVRGERVAGSKRHRRFLATALQSALFNEVLERRLEGVDRVVVGDVAIVHTTEALFVVDDGGAGSERATKFEISPTGPLLGPKMMRAGGEAGELEERVFSDAGLGAGPDLESALERLRRLRLFGSRRPLRVPVADLDASATADRFVVTFELPPGSYATVLLDEIFGIGNLVEGAVEP